MLFIDNKYTRWYYAIVSRAQLRLISGYHEVHHVVPKSLGGSNATDNLVSLTAREHFVCHWLLTKMISDKRGKQKMNHAFWAMATLSSNVQYRYKIKSSQYEIIRRRYIEQFTSSNPMKDPVIQEKRLASWKASRAARACIPPRILKDKFITPCGVFKTKKDIQKVLGIPEHTLNNIYNNLDGFPTSNGRKSKKISHLNINPTLSWRDNGFGLLTVS